MQKMDAMDRSRRRLRYGGPDDGDEHYPPPPPEPRKGDPERYRYIPTFVLVARSFDRTFFYQMVDYFFARKKWPSFRNLTPEFREFLARRGVSEDSVEEMPGFAPKWMFVVQDVSPEANTIAIERFFRTRKIMALANMPRHIVKIVKAKNIDENEYY